MSEIRSVVKVAQDLREIENLYLAVLVQAINKASARIDGTSLPGGEAMVALAHVGSPHEWAELVAAEEWFHLARCERLDHTRCRYAEHVLDEDGVEPPLQSLLFWSEQWREERGYPIEGRPTITSEVRFLRWALEWAWDSLPEWNDFAKDIASTRTRLENLLLAGERAQRGAPCIYDTCKGARLVRKLEPYRDTNGAKAWRWTKWHCPKCKRGWDETEYARNVAAEAWRAQREEIDGEVWCSTKYAAAVVKRSDSTIRQWLHKGYLATACIVAGRRVRFVRLSDVEQRHEQAQRRKHAA